VSKRANSTTKTVDEQLDASLNGEHASPPIPNEEMDDPFDPKSHARRQDADLFGAAVPVLAEVQVSRPDKTSFVRVHPDPAYRMEAFILEVKRESYLIKPGLEEQLSNEPAMSRKLLVLAVDQDGTVVLWPIRLPGDDGRIDSWNAAAAEAAKRAMTEWIRLKPNQRVGRYDVSSAIDQSPVPKFPDLTLREINKIAFANKLIDSWDHPVLKRLRGEG